MAVLGRKFKNTWFSNNLTLLGRLVPSQSAHFSLPPDKFTLPKGLWITWTNKLWGHFQPSLQKCKLADLILLEQIRKEEEDEFQSISFLGDLCSESLGVFLKQDSLFYSTVSGRIFAVFDSLFLITTAARSNSGSNITALPRSQEKLFKTKIWFRVGRWKSFCRLTHSHAFLSHSIHFSSKW